jgi:FixJ family two-component response regulator
VAVKAISDGAADFLVKPVRSATLLESVSRAVAKGRQFTTQRADRSKIDALLAALTERERQVLDRMICGEATKIIAADLGISQRTAEHHRQSVMRKTGAKSLAMLVRMVGLPSAPE